MDLRPMSGEEVQKLAVSVVSAPKEAVERLRELISPNDVNAIAEATIDGTISALEKRNLTITDASGKAVKLKVHPKQTRVKLAGKKSSSAALKTNMQCSLTYIGGVTNLVTTADCK